MPNRTWRRSSPLSARWCGKSARAKRPRLVGITAQGDGLWLLDAEGRAVRPPILWSDARAASVLSEWLENGVAEQGFRLCGSVLFPGAAAPLLAYLQEHEPESLAAAATAGYCKDAILQRLTGARVTDVSDASLPFFDPRLRAYDEDALALYGIEAWRHLLPPVDPTPAPLRATDQRGSGADRPPRRNANPCGPVRSRCHHARGRRDGTG